MKNIYSYLKYSLLILIQLVTLGISKAQSPGYEILLTNDQQVSSLEYEFDIYIKRNGANIFEYANNSQYFINFNPLIKNGGTLSFSILAGTCELNAVQQVLQSRLSVDNTNNRLRIAAHSPSGAGSGTMISNSGLGTRLGRFRITNTVLFSLVQPDLTWYNTTSGFYTRIFAYVSGLNTEITNPAFHFVSLTNSSLPVEISSFRYKLSKNNVTLQWITEYEINNAGFDIERKDIKTGSEWKKIGYIPGSGTTTEPKEYYFDDRQLMSSVYCYRLKQSDYNGSSTYFLLQDEVKIEAPNVFSLGQNYPNPSNPKSKIDYEMPITGKITIKLYNMLGQEVYNIVNETKDAGYYSAEFDGSNLASGVYFYMIIAEGDGQSFTKTLKLILVK